MSAIATTFAALFKGAQRIVRSTIVKQKQNTEHTEQAQRAPRKAI
jgi:hypothetical protein